MTSTYTLTIPGYQPVTGDLVTVAPPPPPPPPMPLLARLKHDKERSPMPARDFGATNIIPEPFRAKPGQTIPVKNYPALISLLMALNPSYTEARARDLLGEGLCWCNSQWGVMTDSVITGGAVLEVEKIEAGRVYFKSILISGPIPTAEYVLSHHLSTLAVSVKKDRTPVMMTRPNGYGTRSQVRMFIVRKTVEPLWFPAADVQILPSGWEPPSPVWLPS